MRLKAMILIALLAFMAAACAVPVPVDGGAAACASPMFGIITDADFQITALIPGSPAEEAGMQVGDTLLDATWIKMNPEPCNDVIMVNAQGSPLSPPPFVVSAPVAEPEHPTGPIPFSDKEGIQLLASYKVTSNVRIRRGDQIMEFTVTPNLTGTGYFGDHEVSTTPVPTVTPLPADYRFF